MGIKKRSTRRHAPGKRQPRQADRAALIIPIVAGLAVLAIVVGVIFSIENRPPIAGGHNISVPVTTVQPQPTRQPPFPNVPRISPQTAKERVDAGQAVLIDVRSKQAYDSQHAAGALSFPEEEIEARLQELPRDKDLILYCT